MIIAMSINEAGAMERIQEYYTTFALSIGAIVVATLLVSSARARKYAAAPYTVPIPEQCKPGWDGKVLDSPSLKVDSQP